MRRTLFRLSQQQFLGPPSWSVRSLLPSGSSSGATKQDHEQEHEEIARETVAHLLRLSALPPPADTNALRNHLRFVRSLQSVPTQGVEPLAGIRDEVGLEEYGFEDVVRDEEGDGGEGGRVQWDAAALAGKKVGRFFVVEAQGRDD
jgi:Glu-tRNAGln amidotransferase C subunit